MFIARVWRGLWRAATALGIAGVLVGTGIGVSGSVAGATPTPASTAAATWLEGQLVTSNHYVTTFTPTTQPPSPGLTADGLFAFAAAGSTFDTQVTATAGWLDTSGNVGTYIGPSKNYPGGLANLALAAEVAQAAGFSYSPTSFAGTNLISDLEATETRTSASADNGEFLDPRDTPTYLGYANPTVQALAIIAIEHATSGFSGLPAAVTFLEGRACTTHSAPYGYPSTYVYGPCTSSAAGGDVDTTGAVSQALSYYAAQTRNATAKTAAEEANAWLDHVKVAVPSMKDTWENYCQSPYTTLEPSVNSTALAIEGLADDPRGPSQYATDITRGRNWLASAQDTTPGGTDGSLPACTASGAGNVRATTQGIQGLTETSWVKLL